MTTELKRVIPEDNLRQMARQIQQTGPVSNLRITRMHFLRTIHWGQPALAPCFKGPYQAFVSIGTALSQAHVIVEGDGQNQNWAFALWLMPEQGWRIESFHVTPSSILGKSAIDVRDIARAEKERGHSFNAAILYATAGDLAYRGPYLQPRAVRDIADEMAKVPLPSALQGQAPFVWHSTGADFTILGLQSIAFTDKDRMYLSIVQQIEPWSNDTEPEQRNQALIAHVRQTFPEYSTVFAGLALRAEERGTRRAFRTAFTASATGE
jgi:hypothetical protein